jgi:hypothetical protein
MLYQHVRHQGVSTAYVRFGTLNGVRVAVGKPKPTAGRQTGLGEAQADERPATQ